MLVQLRKMYEQVIQEKWTYRYITWLSHALGTAVSPNLHSTALVDHCSSQAEQTSHHIFPECPSLIPHIPIPETNASRNEGQT